MAPETLKRGLCGGHAARPRALRVLIADDDDLIQESLRAQLLARQVRADVAGDGKAALALAELHRYDLIFMDIDMPDMDGRSATRAIRDAGVASLIVAVTSDAAGREGHLAAGCNAVETKPLSASSLSAWLREVESRCELC